MIGMATNKVVYGTTVLVDLTEDTVTADKLVSGITATAANGEKITGSLDSFPNNQNPTNPDLLLSYMGNQKTSTYILPYSYYTGADKVLKTDSTVSIQISNSSLASSIGLTADKIVSGNTILGVSGSVVIQKYYTGSATPSSSLGNNGDIYLMVG